MKYKLFAGGSRSGKEVHTLTLPMHYCEEPVEIVGEDEQGPVFRLCDKVTRIKIDNSGLPMWICVEHYDQLVTNERA